MLLCSILLYDALQKEGPRPGASLVFSPAGEATSDEFVLSHRNSLSHAAFMSGRAQAAIRLSLDVDVQA